MVGEIIGWFDVELPYGLQGNHIYNTELQRFDKQSGKSCCHYRLAQTVVTIGTESWLYEDFKDGEVFPPGYTIYRKDRDRFGGGVFIAVMSHYISYELHEVNTNCEIIWKKWSGNNPLA